MVQRIVVVIHWSGSGASGLEEHQLRLFVSDLPAGLLEAIGYGAFASLNASIGKLIAQAVRTLPKS